MVQIWWAGYLSDTSSSGWSKIHKVDEHEELNAIYPGGWGFCLGGHDPSLTNKTTAKEQQEANVYIWGTNKESILSLDDHQKPDNNHPNNKDTDMILLGTNVKTAAAGFSTCALCLADNTIAIVDSNSTYHQTQQPELHNIGSTSYTPSTLCNTILLLSKTISLPMPVASIAVGTEHMLLLTEAGSVYSWGQTTQEQVGITAQKDTSPGFIAESPKEGAQKLNHAIFNNTDKQQQQPILVLGPGMEDESLYYKDRTLQKRVVCIAVGASHSLAVTEEGRCVAWGSNKYGQCGNGEWGSTVLQPTIVEALGPLKIIVVAGGQGHSLCLTDSGDVYAWGLSDCKQTLGCELLQGQSSAEPLLVDHPLLENEHIIKISCGAYHSLALTRQGTLYGWGADKYGCLSGNRFSNNNTDTNTSSTRSRIRTSSITSSSIRTSKHVNMDVHVVEGLPQGRKVVDVATGWWHTLVLLDDEEEVV